MALVPGPVLYLFKATPLAQITIAGVSLPVRLMVGRSCGLSSGEITNIMASGTFNNADLERAAIFLRRLGQTSRTTLFLQTSP